jgi:hypothetical protein
VLDSGESIPNGYQKITFHIVFDIKYDLRHKARLLAGENIPKGYQKIPYHIVFDVKYDLRHKARLFV